MRLLKVSMYFMIILFIAKYHYSGDKNSQGNSYDNNRNALTERQYINQLPDSLWIFSNENLLQPQYYLITTTENQHSYAPLNIPGQIFVLPHYPDKFLLRNIYEANTIQ